MVLNRKLDDAARDVGRAKWGIMEMRHGESDGSEKLENRENHHHSVPAGLRPPGHLLEPHAPRTSISAPWSGRFAAPLLVEATTADSGLSFRGAVVDVAQRKGSEHWSIRLNRQLDQQVRQRTEELESSNRALLAACRELESFSYTVAHDLRTPLRSMCGFSSVLLEDYPDRLDADGKEMLHRIGAAAERMGRLVDGILELSVATRSKLRRENVNLSLLAHDVVKVFNELDAGRQVETVIAEGVYAHGDPLLLRQVLENLLGNAWKYTGNAPSPRVEFGAGSQDGEVIYFVRDNGIGFDMRHAAKLFTPFARVHGVGDFKGIGIGLATVQRIITRHEGRIWTEGAPGEGATFYFCLTPAPEGIKR